MKQKTSIVFILLAVLLLTAACSQAEKTPATTKSPQSAASAIPSSPASPESNAVLGTFAATDLDGNRVDQSIFAGHKLTMINIWATFCGPCLGEMPTLGVLHQEYQDRGFQIVGIVTDTMEQDGSISQSQVAVAKEAVEKTGAAYLHLLPSNDLFDAVLNQVYSVPETIFVDEYGKQVGKSYSGARTKAQWRKIIDGLLAEVDE